MKAVQIVGGGYGNIPFPFDDSKEIWLINSVIRARYSFDFYLWTEYYDIHTKAWIIEKRPEMYEWYKKQVKPIYLAEFDEEIADCRVFDFDLYLSYFNTNRFAHTLDWLIAKAIHENYEQIELYYCPLDNHDKTTTAYWIGRAEEHNISIICDDTFGLIHRTELYRK